MREPIFNIFREQCDGIVSCDATGRPLPMVFAWRNASAVYWIRAPFPVTSVRFKIADETASRYVRVQSAYYHPVRGLWRVYLPAGWFGSRCETAYEVEAENEEGARCVFGEGRIRVQGGLVLDGDEESGSQPETCYALFPDGCYRKILVSEDETGSPAFVVSYKSLAPSSFAVSPSQLYAYDRKTGFFHEVSGCFDESGTPTLVVSEEAVRSGECFFAKDERTNLYYRVETTLDEAGVSALVTGETKST